MGQKVHPESMRVGYIHDWKSNWFNERHFSDFLIEDVRIRDHITNKLAHAGLSDITIRKDAGEVEVNIHTARPGIVIGKSGSEVDALRRDLHRLTGKAIKVNILEIKRPELDAKLVAQSIAEQLVNRVAFRRAMKRSLTSAMRSGAKGCRIQVSGRLGGAEMARTESYADGRVPLHTLRADIDYGFYEAKTTFGRIGVKCWINKGEIMPAGYTGTDLTSLDEPASRAPAIATTAAAVVAATAVTAVGAAAGVATVAAVRVAAAARAAAAVAARAAAVAAARAAAAVVARAAVAAARVAAVAGAPTSAEGSRADAVPQASQVQEAASRPARGVLARPADRRLRRVRPQGARERLAHQPPDRGRSYRDDAQDQAWRQGLDQRLSGQAVHEEAGRDPHGLRQGQPGGLGRRRQARARDVRARRRRRAARPRGDAPRRPQASRQDQVRHARGRVRRMKARELRDLSDDGLRDRIATARRDLFGLRMQHATGELENTAGLSRRKRDLARALTVAHQRGIDSNVTVTIDTADDRRRELMADEDKTPETEEKAPDSIQEEVATAASEEGAGDTSTVDAR